MVGRYCNRIIDRVKFIMKESLLKLTQKITTWHVTLFEFLTRKSKTSLFFTWLLVFICLYEIFEHVVIPLALIWWGFFK